MIVLALDIGTTTLKIGLFGKKSRLLSLTRVPCEVSFPKPGWAQISPEAWWRVFLRELPRVCAAAGVRPCDVGAIGMSTLCPALVPMDSKGSALHDAIIYLDQRSINEVRAASGAVSDRTIARITGNRIAPGTISLSSILWLKKHKPGLYRRTGVFGHANTFFGHKLTGSFGIDWTNASFAGLFDIRKRQWSPRLCRAFRISPEKLPPVLSPSSIIGAVSLRASRQTGLKAGIPVAMGAADTACSALALGVTRRGQSFATSGGSEVITVCSDTPRLNVSFLNRCHVIEDRWLCHGTVSTSGSAVEWFRNVIEVRDYDALLARVRKSPSGANGVVFLPYLMGERSPIWNPHIKGSFIGLTPAVNLNDMTRAVLEGVGYALRYIIERVERDTAVALNDVVLVGNGARNTTWTQMKSDITGKTFSISAMEETALHGAAIIAMVAAGAHVSYDQAIRAIGDFRCKAIPPRRPSRYEDNYELFKRSLHMGK